MRARGEELAGQGPGQELPVREAIACLRVYGLSEASAAEAAATLDLPPDATQARLYCLRDQGAVRVARSLIRRQLAALHEHTPRKRRLTQSVVSPASRLGNGPEYA